jgi:hypothetical protein
VMARDIILEHFNVQLQDLENNYTSVAKQLRFELDGPTINTLNYRLEEIGQQMATKEEEIASHQKKSALNYARIKARALIEILENHPDELVVMKDAYRKTLIRHPCNVRSHEPSVQDIIAALEGIPCSTTSSYSASDEFFARLIQGTDSLELKQALVQWIEQYRKELDWNLIQKEIDSFDKTIDKTNKPGLLIDIALDEETSTQENQDYYRLLAWWVKDMQGEPQKRSYIRLIEPGTDASGPFLLERFPDQILTLFGRFIEQKNSHCPQARKEPEIHIFLPRNLLGHEVDLWPCSQVDNLGKEYEVMIHCAERYQKSYRKRPTWLNLWDQHTQSQKVTASNVFIKENKDDPSDLRNQVRKALRPREDVEAERSIYVGLKLASPPCIFDAEDIFEVWLDFGLPLGIWSRCELRENAHSTQLDELLGAGCLEQLPRRVKNKRDDGQNQNTKDCCIGHHLALLWDDPTVSPPSALPQAG